MSTTDTSRHGYTRAHHAPRVYPFLRFHTERPATTQASLCGCLCATMVLVIILALAVPGFLPFSNDVPLYIRDNVAQERADAVRAGQRDATLALPRPEVELFRSVREVQSADARADRETLTLELLYVSKTSDIFTVAALNTILGIENAIRSHEHYASFCALDWTDADLAAEFNTTFAVAANANLPPCRPPLSALWHCNPAATNASDCSATNASPAGLLDCTDTSPGAPSCDPLVSGATVTADFRTAKLVQYAAPAPVPHSFLAYVDNQFGDGNINSAALRTIFEFALPLPGFAGITDRPAEQEDLIRTFLFDSYHDFLTDISTSSSAPFALYVDGFGMTDLYVAQIIPQDAMLAVGSFIAVLIYMAVLNRSWFLAFCGMGQILLAFFPAYIFYRAILQQQSVTPFSLLSIYLVLAVGADDIFVSIDSWNAAAAIGKFSIAHRLSYAWSHSSKAMLVTSVTTVCSLLANATSSFPAISTFGLIAASLITANYVLVIVVFPAIIITYHTYFETEYAFCCGAGVFLSAHCPPDCCRDLTDDSLDTAPFYSEQAESGAWSAALSDSDRAEQEEEEEASSSSSASSSTTTETATSVRIVDVDDGAVGYLAHAGPGDDIEHKSMIVRCFEGPFATGIIRMRITIVLAFVVFFVFAVIFASALKADPDPPAFLPEGNMYADYASEVVARMARGPSLFSVRKRLVHGFVPSDPVSRSGTEPTDVDDVGAPRWDPDFAIHVAFDCIAHLLEAAEVRSDTLATGGPPAYTVTSFVLPLKAFIETKYGAAAYAAATGVNGDAAMFRSYAVEFFETGDNFNTYSEFIYGLAPYPGAPSNETRVTFVYSELRLTASQYVEFDKGIDLFYRWESWFATQVATAPRCAGVPHVAGFQYSSADVFWFIQEKLVDEAFAGVGLSLGLAIIVLVLATGNVYVGLIAGATIGCIVVTVLAFMVLLGWKLGVLESILLVLVPGLSVDYVAHLAQGYVDAPVAARRARVRAMLGEVGISVLSGSISTLLAASLLLFTVLVFFVQFGTAIAITIISSLIWSLFAFPAVLALIGPQGDTGNWFVWAAAAWAWIQRKRGVVPVSTSSDTGTELPTHSASYA